MFAHRIATRPRTGLQQLELGRSARERLRQRLELELAAAGNPCAEQLADLAVRALEVEL